MRRTARRGSLRSLVDALQIAEKRVAHGFDHGQSLRFVSLCQSLQNNAMVAAHSWIADKVSKTPGQAIQAVRDDEVIEDPKLRALAEFTRTTVISRGNPTQARLEAFVSAGYTEKNVLEIILALAVKTISNYSNHLLHTEVDARFESAAWPPKA